MRRVRYRRQLARGYMLRDEELWRALREMKPMERRAVCVTLHTGMLRGIIDHALDPGAMYDDDEDAAGMPTLMPGATMQ